MSISDLSKMDTTNAASGSTQISKHLAAAQLENELDRVRQSLIQTKQAEMRRAESSHDALIREKFHMERFKLMTEYDPKNAKRDTSQVFEEYKASYDLWGDLPVGPSRLTRRTHQDLRQSFPSHPTPSKSSKTQPTSSTPRRRSFPSVSSNGNSKRASPRAPHSPLHAFPSLPSTSTKPHSILPEHELLSNSDLVRSSRPRKRRKTETGPRLDSAISESSTRHRSSSLSSISCPPTPKPRPRTSIPKSLNKRTRPRELSPSPPLPPLPPNLASIKRIKLIVRKPIDPISNPQQRPDPPKFYYDVPRYIASYRTLNGEDVDENEWNDTIARDASILNEAHQLRTEGRVFPGCEILLGGEDDGDLWEEQTPGRTSEDIWDQVLEEVKEEVGERRRMWAHGGWERHGATHVAAKLKANWEARENRKVREAAMSEKRIKTLAKVTGRLVLDEWKKVVFHIREQERLKEEAEEVRRGQTHLDEILNQSGQLLESQQAELLRADSSRSRSESVASWGNETDSDDEEETKGAESSGTTPLATDEDGDLETDHSQPDDQTEEPLELVYPEEDESSTTALQQSPFMESQSDDAFGPHALLRLDHLQSPIKTLPTDPLASLIHDFEDISIPTQPHPSSYRDGAFPLSSPETDFLHNLSLPPLFPEEQLFSTRMSDFSVPPPPPTSSGPNDSPSPSKSFPRNSSSHLVEQPHASSHPGSSHENSLPWNNDHHKVDLFTSMEDSPQTLEDHESVSHPPSSDQEEEPSLAQPSQPDGEASASENDAPELTVPEYLKPFSVAPVQWNPENKIVPPLLLRGTLRPYQQSGLEWLASLHSNNLNGILADEMGLGKTIQTIALLAHLACDRGIWGPHLVIVPTSVLLNWEMEFKKFLPGFKVLSYHGTTKRRRELRQGWTDKHHFNVCITSYTLATRDAHILKKKAWYYMILDEAHMIKNFKSQRWNILLMFRSFRRLLLTGTPLQNNLTELWALLQFLMAGSDFANLKEFGDWFSNPLERAIEMGNFQDDDTQQRAQKLHAVLRPYLLRRLKRDVEKELPSKYEHLVLCPLSKRQRFLYDEFMSRRQTRDALQSGQYQQIANILMQLRKVCNHPDLFEVRPIVTSFAMPRSAVADFEITELLVRRRLLSDLDDDAVDLRLSGLQFIDKVNTPVLAALSTKRLDATFQLPHLLDGVGTLPVKDTRTIEGYLVYASHKKQADTVVKWHHIAHRNRLRCFYQSVVLGEELIRAMTFCQPITPLSVIDWRYSFLSTNRTAHSTVKSLEDRSDEMANIVDKFAFATPPVIAPRDVAEVAVDNVQAQAVLDKYTPWFDRVLHRASARLQIAFPDPSLLQYDCGKLQRLTQLLREKKRGGHRVLIFTQMTRILDILEIFLNLNGYLYLRLDGATKIEDRQYVTARFNADSRVFAFIASSRSGGVGINLTGADTVIFYDSDFNPQMDRQCEDRAHRIGQIRDVHIYRFVSQHTVEEAMLRKANQKRSLDELVIQKGKFDWSSLFGSTEGHTGDEPLRPSLDEGALAKALGQFEDHEDQEAARQAAEEEVDLEGADQADFEAEENVNSMRRPDDDAGPMGDGDEEEEPYCYGQGGSVVDFMLDVAEKDWDFFSEWRI